MIYEMEDLWILTKAGITLFRRIQHNLIEDQLFGALMSALNTLTSTIFEGDISNFGVKNIQFTLMKKKDLIFVASFPKKTKEKKILEALEFISKRFFELYPEDVLNNILTSWDGDIEMFSDFGEKLFESTEEKFKELF